MTTQPPTDHRIEDLPYPMGDWQSAVRKDETRLGYWAWVEEQRDLTETMLTRAERLDIRLSKRDVLDLIVRDTTLYHGFGARIPLCPVAELPRYLVVMTRSAESQVRTADTRSEVREIVFDAFTSGAPWFPSHILDLDTGTDVIWMMDITLQEDV